MITLDEMLHYADEREASDLFIRANCRPAMRVHGRIAETEFAPLTAEETRAIAYSKMTGRQIEEFDRHHEMDLAFDLGSSSRVRCSVYKQRGTVALSNRLIPMRIRSLEELGMPPTLAEQAQVMLEHFECVCQVAPASKAVPYFRKFTAGYSKRHPERKKTLLSLMAARSRDQLIAAIKEAYGV